VLSGRVIEFEAGRSFHEQAQYNISSGLPVVPVMPETLLLMELCAQGNSVDLSEMAQVVSGDPGATLQIMREAGQECAFGDERPHRIEDYISALGAEACLEAASRKTVSRSMNKPAITWVWSHSIEIAKRCRLMAEVDMNPDEAYLTGLLHEIGSLPSILDWKANPVVSSDPLVAGLKLADLWCLPRCVAEYFAELANLSGTCRWSHMVMRAHEISSLPAANRPIVDSPETWAAASSRL
jgi:hypothetical protein